jgi:hypothetical protein
MEEDVIQARRRRRAFKKMQVKKGNKISPASNAPRAIFNDMAEQFPGKITTQSYLRFEVPLSSSSDIIFPVLQNQGAQVSTERRLAINDAFLIYDLSIMIKKVPTGGAQGGVMLNTWPNPLTYTGGAGAEALAMNGIYNGFLTIRQNSTVFIDSLDVLRYLRIGAAQKGVDLGAGTGASPNIYLADNYNSANYPFMPLTPGILLDGSKKNEIRIQLPDSVDMSGTSSTNYAVCFCRGLLISDGADFQNKKG